MKSPRRVLALLTLIAASAPGFTPILNAAPQTDPPGATIPSATAASQPNTALTASSFAGLSAEQHRLFESYVNRGKDPGLPIAVAWDTLNESQASVFCSITHALENTLLTDARGRSLGPVIRYIRAIEEIRGEEVPRRPSQTMRLFVLLSSDARSVLKRAVDFSRGVNAHVLHPGYPDTFRQDRLPGLRGKEAGLQISLSRDGLHGDIDIDYCFGVCHLSLDNSDVRARNHLKRHCARWPGLQPLWRRSS